MNHIKPTYEAVNPNIESSFTCRKFLRNENLKAHVWHYHPEIELVFVKGGSGKRQVGSNVSYFTNGELILIGSNVPHCGLTNENTNNDYEVVIQFKPDFLGENFLKIQEMNKIVALLEASKGGLVFSDKIKKSVGKKINALSEANPLERLLNLITILDELSNTKDFQVLNAGKFYLKTQVEDNDRINLIFNHVKDNFKEQISLEEISDLASMTVPSFCRYFKKITNKTFTQFVNEYRIVHSMKLLAEKPLSITEICFESGFNNFSYFNKTFKEYIGKNPSEYRKQFSRIVE